MYPPSVNKLVLNSYAKLNLYLEVINKRKDNYHNIKTIFERIDLSDRIILRSRQDKRIKIICNSPSVPKDSSNLTYRSARLLQDEFHINRGVDIKIIKRIPVASGLGGGSSNAAAVLLGLNKLWRLKLSQDKLVALAKRLGCDVPFFIYNCPFAEGRGCGDRIKPLKALGRLKLWQVLVVPKIKVCTALIYKKWDELRQTLIPAFLVKKNRIKLERAGLTASKYDVRMLNLALKKKDLGLLEKVLFNSLQEVTTGLYPKLIQLRKKLNKLGLKSILMSGSGPAMFGMVSSGKEARVLSRRLKKKEKSWQVYVTRTI